MAKKEATLIIKVKQVGQKVLKSIPGMLKGIGEMALKAGAALGTLTAGAIAFARTAAQYDAVRQSFENLAASQGQNADQMLGKMRALSKGTVDDMTLMKQANQALLLGLPVDRFGDMLEIARSSSKATGESMEFMLNSIVTGLGRGCISGKAVSSFGYKSEISNLCLKDAYEKDLKKQKILGLNKSQESCGYVNFGGVEFSGERQCVKISTKTQSLSLTPDHLIFTNKGWVRADESLGLKIGLRYLTFIKYEEITSVEDDGLHYTYDAINSETDSFVVNGFIVHNSKLVLDNLGIVFKAEDAYKEYAASIGKTADKLTEAEKKQAFINKALEVGKANAEAAGGAQLTLDDRLAQTQATMKNLSVVIGKNTAPMLEFFLDKVEDTSKAIEEWVQSSQALSFFRSLTKVVNFAKLSIEGLGASIGIGLAAIIEAGSAALDGQFSRAKDIMSGGIDEVQEMMKEKREQFEADNAEIDALYDERQKQRQLEERQRKKQHLAALQADQVKDKKQTQKLAAEEHSAEVKWAMKTLKLEQLTNDQKESYKRQSLSKISSLQNSNNKTLATIGKAAALTQIAIEAPVGVARALAAFPPPANFVAAALVGTAFAAQAAQVAGIQLAEGGIVQATPGGIQATIGEGGQDEAVIPLEEGANNLGTTVNVTVYGGLLGDESSAREFAAAVDNELLKLRQDNESVAFDEGVI